MFKSTKGLLVRDWKQDTISLIQFPRLKCIPSGSMFALKLETWLRFTKLNYVNVSNDFTNGSAKGQVPFIELNGRQFANSNHIIEHLIQHYNLPIDRSMTTRERAEARAITLLVEESLARVIMYDRSRNIKWMFTADKGTLDNLNGVKKTLIQHAGPVKIQYNLKKTLHAQGIGRNTPEEVDEIAKKDLAALSVFLGEKRYFFGDKPTTLDATVFGTLAQIVFTPLNSDKIKAFMEASTPNLMEFVQRIKNDYWPDWTKICETLELNAHIPAPAQAPGASSHGIAGVQPSAESVLHATASSQ